MFWSGLTAPGESGLLKASGSNRTSPLNLIGICKQVLGVVPRVNTPTLKLVFNLSQMYSKYLECN